MSPNCAEICHVNQMGSDEVISGCGLLSHPIISAALMPAVTGKQNEADAVVTIHSLFRNHTPLYAQKYVSAIANGQNYPSETAVTTTVLASDKVTRVCLVV
jgi:hypothetical protein